MKYLAHILFFLSGIFGFTTYAQITNSYHYEAPTKGILEKVFDSEELEDESILITGRYAENFQMFPVIMKIDTMGEVVWSTYNYYQPVFNNVNSLEIEHIEADTAYFSMSAQGGNGPNSTYLKINLTDGSTIWNNSMNMYFPHQAFLNYSDTSFLALRNAELTTYDKLTGDSLNTEVADLGLSGDRMICSDQQMNLYLAQGNRIQKYNRKDLSCKLWSVDLPNADEILYLYVTNDNQLIVGTNDGLYDLEFYKINLATGTIEWEFNPYQGEDGISGIYEKDGHLFLMYYIYPNAFRVSKVNLDTGVEIWYSDSDVDYNNSHISTEGHFAQGLDFDCNGQIHITGEFGRGYFPSITPSFWGGSKINSFGIEQADYVVIEDSVSSESWSKGVGVHVLNNKVYVIGSLENENNQGTKAFFLELATSNLQMLQRKYIGLDNQKFSATKDMVQANNKVYYLKQVGDSVFLHCTTNLGAFEWETALNNQVAEKGVKLIAHNNKVYASVEGEQNGVSSFQLYELDANTGVLLNTYSAPTTSFDKSVFDMVENANGIFVFYLEGNGVKCIPWNASFGSPVLLETAGSNMSELEVLKLVETVNASTFAYLAQDEIKLINTQNMNVTMGANLGSAYNFYNMMKIQNDFILAGKNTNNEQVLLSYDVNFSLNWLQTYEEGALVGLDNFEVTKFVASGIKNDSACLYTIESSSGNVLSEFTHQSTNDNYSNFKEVHYLPGKNLFIATANTYEYSIQSKGQIHLISPTMLSIWNQELDGDFMANTGVISSLVINDTTCLVGGAQNTNTLGKKGFVYTIIPQDSLVFFDCNNDVYGSAYLDSCGVCVEGQTGMDPCIKDCYNEWGGTAFLDSCGVCAGGSTGLIPVINPALCDVGTETLSALEELNIVPNPTSGKVEIFGLEGDKINTMVFDSKGSLVLEPGETRIIDLTRLAPGIYNFVIHYRNGVTQKKVVKID